MLIVVLELTWPTGRSPRCHQIANEVANDCGSGDDENDGWARVTLSDSKRERMVRHRPWFDGNGADEDDHDDDDDDDDDGVGDDAADDADDDDVDDDDDDDDHDDLDTTLGDAMWSAE